MNPLKDNQKSKRIQLYFLSVYVLPSVLGFTICCINYSLTTKYSLNNTDRISGYIIGIVASIVLYYRNRFKWLPHPDGSYINTKELIDKKNNLIMGEQSYIIEHPNYLMSFSYSTVTKILHLITGLTTTSTGIYLISKSSIIFPSLIIIAGIFLSYIGFSEIVSTAPKLKLAKEGLWTKELGFKSWASIYKTEIKVEKGSRFSHTYLEIYLKNSEFNYPIQRLQLNDIKNKDKIKTMIDELSKTNNPRR